MITWTEDYSVYKTSLAGVITLVVAYEKDGYKVSAHGATAILRLKDNVASLEKGKAHAIVLGKKLLKKAIESLDSQ